MKAQLKTKHIFKVLEISKKVGLTEDLSGLVSQNGADAESFGGQIVGKLLENIDKAEVEIFELLADVFGKTVAEVEDQPIRETFSMIKLIFASEGILDFFSEPEK